MIRKPWVRRTPLLVAAILFIVALVPRAGLIITRPDAYPLDLALYWASGELVSNGINPYDYEEGAAVRHEIFRYHSQELGWTFPATEADWNYYAASNLPLTLLLFGGIHSIDPDPNAYRWVFGVSDALIAAVAFLLIRRTWDLRDDRLAALIALIFAASPAFLEWGAILPQDKGIQTLLMLVVLLIASVRPRPGPALFGFAVLMGAFLAASIAFKGMGIFLLPAAAVWAYRQGRWNGILVTFGVCLSVLGLVLAPFASAVASIAEQRLATNTVEVAQHSSIWVIPWRHLPILATLRINLIVSVFAGLGALWMWLRGRISAEFLGGLLTFIFADILLVAGGVDRMSIGITLCLITMGMHRVSWGLIGTAVWVIPATLIKFVEPDVEGLLILGGTVMVVALLAARRPAQKLEAVSQTR